MASRPNKIIIRNHLREETGKRRVELIAPNAKVVRYTLGGEEAREGMVHEGPFEIGDGEVMINVFAEADGIEAKTIIRYPSKGKKGVEVNPVKPGRMVSRTGRKLDSRAKTFEALSEAGAKSVEFENVTLSIGQGAQVAQFVVGEIRVNAAFIEEILKKVLEKFTPDTPITMTFRRAHFSSGHDLKDFAGKLGIELQASDIEQ